MDRRNQYRRIFGTYKSLDPKRIHYFRDNFCLGKINHIDSDGNYLRMLSNKKSEDRNFVINLIEIYNIEYNIIL